MENLELQEVKGQLLIGVNKSEMPSLLLSFRHSLLSPLVTSEVSFVCSQYLALSAVCILFTGKINHLHLLALILVLLWCQNITWLTQEYIIYAPVVMLVLNSDRYVVTIKVNILQKICKYCYFITNWQSRQKLVLRTQPFVNKQLFQNQISKNKALQSENFNCNTLYKSMHKRVAREIWVMFFFF